MGAYLSKLLDDIDENTQDEVIQPGTPLCKPITTDPRSPPTAGVERTPLPNAPAQDNQAPMDPRSPCPGIPRTPLHVPIFDTPPDTPEPMPRLVLSDQLETPDQRRVSDPRSPNCEVERTPVIADCDVHRSWPADQSIVDEGDSLYPNPASMIGGDLDLSIDDLDDPAGDHGSLENLLMYNSSLTDTGIEEDGLYSEESSVQEAQDVCEDKSDEKEPDVSPIGSPVKSQSAKSAQNTSSIKVLSDTDAETKPPVVIRASTPNSKAAMRSGSRGLTHRDTNSPLSIIQRKQTHKIHNQIAVKPGQDQSRNTSGFSVALDKENVA